MNQRMVRIYHTEFFFLLCAWCRLLHGLLSGKARHLTSSYFQHLYQLSVAEKEVIRGSLEIFCFTADIFNDNKKESNKTNTSIHIVNFRESAVIQFQSGRSR